MTEFRGFTEKSGASLNKALALAMRMGHTFVGSEHILYGLAAEKDGAAALILARYGIHEQEIESNIEKSIGKGIVTKLTIRDFSPKGRHIMEKAIEQVYQEFGRRSLALGVHKDNIQAGRFYERHGFKKTGVFEGDDE